MRAYRDEVVVFSIVEASMEREDEIVSVQLGKSSLLIDDGAAGDFFPSGGILFDGFESIQVRSMLLSHEVNGRICSRAQSTQKLVIIDVRGVEGAVGIDVASGSLEEGRVVREVIVNQTRRELRTDLYRARPQMNE